jgi:hypothetical protein
MLKVCGVDEYQVVKEQLDTGTDASGEWWITTKAASRNAASCKGKLKQADDADKEYIVRVFKETFGTIGVEDKNTVLYRGGMSFSSDTFCQPSECSIYVLTDDNSNLLITIFKH